MPSWNRVVLVALVWLWCLLSCCHGWTEAGTATDTAEVLVVIACPPLPRRSLDECFALSDNLREQQQQQLAGVIPGDYSLRFHIMHELFNYWTLLDALPGETRLLNARTEWIIWCQHNTEVASLRGLLQQLHSQDPTESAYYGHALYDTEATIVHHFAHYKNPRWFPYPLLSAGVVFTGVLLRRLAELVALNAQQNGNNHRRHSEFAIDASHELARFIFDNLTPDTSDAIAGETLERKIILKSAAYICPTAAAVQRPHTPETTGTRQPVPFCMLYAKPEMFAGAPAPVLPSTLGNRRLQGVEMEVQGHTTGSHIYFAIKTCAKFHKERIPIIERTWATDARHHRYYSDVAEVGIPTISTGIPNVQTGHCAKTLAILQLSLKDINAQKDMLHIRWLMLVDDDTLLSVPRLSALLNGYNHTEHIYLGERYGYRLYAPDGFNYHTGGAGIVLSLPLVRLILEHCSCPSANAPDDMILGYCLQALGVVALPAAGLHQARPQDYATELLHLQPPISFHKFWNTEPEHTYRRWLGGSSGANHSVPQATGKDRATGGGAAPLPLLQLPGLPTGLATAEKHLDL